MVANSYKLATNLPKHKTVTNCHEIWETRFENYSNFGTFLSQRYGFRGLGI